MNTSAPPRVLVVDRPAVEREALTRALESTGFSVSVADDTHVGFQKLIDGATCAAIVLAVDARSGVAEGFLRLVSSYLRLGGIPVVAILDDGAAAPPLGQVRAAVARGVPVAAIVDAVRAAS